MKLSEELKNFLTELGVASSRSTFCNPEGNGLVEHYNGIIWRTVELALKSRKLPTQQWELVLPDALHLIRSFLCTSINTTPHDRIFLHPRRSSVGLATPSWLMDPGPVLLKQLNRKSKFDSIVEEVYLLESNADYARIRMLDGRETTVSTKWLVPIGSENLDSSQEVEEHDTDSQSKEYNSDPPVTLLDPDITSQQVQHPPQTPSDPFTLHTPTSQSSLTPLSHQLQPAPNTPPILRRSTRSKKRPAHLDDYLLNCTGVNDATAK